MSQPASPGAPGSGGPSRAADQARSELVCTDLASVELACSIGADRIELCSGLEVGGLTPSSGFLAEARALCGGGPELVVLIRTRAGGFGLDGPRELDALRRDVVEAGRAGADGVAIGVLRPDRTLDADALAALIEAAGSMAVTVHRALDVTPDLGEAVAEAAALGATRALTSGGADTAWEGRAALRALSERFSGQVEVIAASGVRGDNAAEVLRETGAGAIHGSCRVRIDPRAARGSGAPPGPVEGAAERWSLDRDAATAFVRAARGIPPRNHRPERG